MSISIEEIFGAGGWLDKSFECYHQRKGQMTLAQAVLDAIENQNHLIAEGPTGIGKSFAYGIPSALYSLGGGGTVVIATANITLQEQLIKKDLPLIAMVLKENKKESLTYALLKGMGNYLCKERLYLAEEDGKIDGNRELEQIADWKTVTGDRSDLDVSVSDNVWREVCAVSEDCAGKKCSQYSSCYVTRARRAKPNILVTNYHLLYTDIVIGGGILPQYDLLVMDEAHCAAEIAMNFNGFDLTVYTIKKACKALFDTTDKKGKVLGLAVMVEAEEFFSELSKLPKEQIFRHPLGFGSSFSSGLVEAAKLISRYAELELSKETDYSESYAAKLGRAASSLLKKAAIIKDISVGVDNDKGEKVLREHHVYYITSEKGFVHLNCKVVDSKRFLRNNVFDGHTVIAVSATMSTPNERGVYSLDFTAGELGLKPKEYVSLTVGSPFEDSQMLVVVPSNFPSPKESERHSQEVAKLIERVAKDIGGKTMALFTSYRALSIAEKYLFTRLGDIRILTQTSWEKSRLISEFKRDSKAIILATSSFWQGVDIPGEDLSCVIIEKFPFLPPNDPVLQYLDEWFKRQGKSSFMSYSLPKAVLSLKQGVGRLIRTETDCGAVVLCDNRISTARYGEHFEGVFPSQCWKSEEVESVKKFIENRSDYA